MNFFFLQVIIDSAKIKDSLARAGIVPAPGKQNLLDILERGGPLMIPLALLLITAVFVFIERVMAINKASRMDENFMNIIRDHIVNNNVTAARSIAKNTNSSTARMIDKGIQRIGKPIDAIEKSMENVGRLELYKMEKTFLFYLSSDILHRCLDSWEPSSACFSCFTISPLPESTAFQILQAGFM